MADTPYTHRNITTGTTTVVKSGAGVLKGITVNTTAAGTVIIYDNTSAAGTKIGTLKSSVVEGTYEYNVAFATGLTIVTGAASDITVAYNQPLGWLVTPSKTMDDPIQRIRQNNEAKARFELEEARHAQEIASINAIDTTIVEVMNSLVKFLDGNVSRTEVVNQIESVSTPDVARVVEAVAELGMITESNRIDLDPLKTALLSLGEKLDQLPKSFPEIPNEVSVKNLSDIEIPEQKDIDLSPIVESIKKITLTATSPEVNVEAPDLSAIDKGLDNVVKQIKAIKFPEIPKTDLTKVEKKLDTSNKILKDILEKPVGGGGGGGSSWVATDENGIPVPFNLSNGSVVTTPKILTERYDYDDSTTIYTASAPIGTADASTGWTITKYDLTDSNNSSGMIATDVSWEDRAIGSYA